MAHCTLDVRSTLEPCLGYSLDRAAKIVAYITMGISVASICLFGFLLIYFLANGIELPKARDDTLFILSPYALLGTIESWRIIGLFGTKLMISLVVFLISRYLAHSVETRDFGGLQLWIQINVILFVGQILTIGIEIFYHENYFFSLLGLIYLAYSIWVVNSFKNEVGMESLIEKTLLTSEGTNHRKPPFFTRL